MDVGTSFAITAAADGLLAPYKVQTWNDIPSTAKAANGDWFDDYGGFVAIGYNSKTVKDPPTSFADLLKPEYKNEVAINGNPTQASAAFSAVFAAALANGGSFNNIQPGITVLREAGLGGQLRARHGRPGDGRERADARSSSGGTTSRSPRSPRRGVPAGRS